MTERREPLVTPDSSLPTRLLLVRHGETEWNREGRYQGSVDVPLNATGYRQATALAAQLLAEPIAAAKFYLDSGWPGDNYELTQAMAAALSQRGYRMPEDFLHLVFPHAQHNERAWGSRLHLPLQLGLGKVAISQRERFL